MKISKIKSNAKLNLALNITGKKKLLHKIESGFLWGGRLSGLTGHLHWTENTSIVRVSQFQGNQE